MPQLWDRREPRLDYRAVVRLASDTHKASLAESQNVSHSGLQVISDRAYDIGTEVTCDIPLPEDHLRLRGRVAWVRVDDPLVSSPQMDDAQDSRRNGMGIEFLDSDGISTEALEKTMQPDTPAPEQQVDAWFEGVSEPVRVSATAGPLGVKLRTSIPFLRLGSKVSFVYMKADGTQVTCEGMLKGARLDITADEQIPCLELGVDESPAAELPPLHHVQNVVLATNAAPIQLTQETTKTEHTPHTDEYEVWDDPLWGSLEGADLSYSQGEHIVTATNTSDIEQYTKVTPPPCPQPRVSESVSLEATEHTPLFDADDLTGDIIEVPTEADIIYADGPDVKDMFDPDVDPEFVRQHTHLVADLDPNLVIDEPNEHDTETEQEFWGSTGRRWWRGWIWAAAFAMSAAAAASLIALESADDPEPNHKEATEAIKSIAAPHNTPVAERKTDIQRAAHTPKPPVAAQKQTTKPAPKAIKASVASKSKKSNAVKQTPTAKQIPPVPEKKSAKKSAKKPIARVAPQKNWKPNIVSRNGTTTLSIPIRGSIAGAVHYPLSKPEGVVVKLPNATPRFAYNDFRPREGGFRVVWVRPYEKGTRLRFLFSKPIPQHHVAITADHVTITLTPTTPAPVGAIN